MPKPSGKTNRAASAPAPSTSTDAPPTPPPGMRPSTKYAWVQESLSNALNDTIKQGDADILGGMGRRLLALSAEMQAGIGQMPASDASLGEALAGARGVPATIKSSMNAES